MVDYEDYENDEYLDPQERELRYQRNRRAMEAFEKDRARYQQEKNAQKQQAEANQIWQDALKEVGISPEQYNELVQKDPSSVKQLYREQVRDFAHKVARKRDPKTGRFLPGRPQQQVQQRETSGDDFWKPTQPSRPASVQGRGRAAQSESLARFQDPKQRTGTDQEHIDMFKAFTEGDDSFNLTK